MDMSAKTSFAWLSRQRPRHKSHPEKNQRLELPDTNTLKTAFNHESKSKKFEPIGQPINVLHLLD